MLLLVRHAMPVVDPGVAPERWELSEQGHAAARALVLPPGAVLVSSAEVKARQTLEPSGQVHVDARFNEVDRAEPFSGDFRSRRRSYVEGAEQPEWEPRSGVVARFDAAISQWRDKAQGRALVIGTHGMALTVWLTARVGLEDPGGFWSSLTFPEVLEVSLEFGRVARR